MAENTRISHTTGHLAGKRDTQLFYQEWAPADGKIRAVILVSHGFAEHSGRYAGLAADLVSAGFVVGAIDHRGHGQSEGKRVQVEKFDDFAEDLRTYEKSLRERYPSPLPLFVVGHSMGGLITLRYLTKIHPSVAGVILSGTAAAKPTDVSGITIAVGNVLAKVAPDVGVVMLQLGKISRDPAVVEAYNNDPLVFNQKIRARLGAEILSTMDSVERDLPKLTVPILIMHGSDDVLTPPEGSEMIAEKMGSPDKTLIIYEGLWHEIYNEPERDAVIDDVISWLDAHLPAG